MTHTNAYGTRKIEILDPLSVEIERQENTPFGKQCLLYGTGLGAVWVDGARSEVESKLRKAAE